MKQQTVQSVRNVLFAVVLSGLVPAAYSQNNTGIAALGGSVVGNVATANGSGIELGGAASALEIAAQTTAAAINARARTI